MSRFRVFIVLLPVLLVVPFIHLQAAELVSAPAVKIFTVTPGNRPAAILAPNAMVAAPPGPMDIATMKDILAGIGGTEGGAHIVLNSRQPYISEQAYLTLTLPQTFHPESAIVFNEDMPNALGVKLKVEKDGLYLVDFAVKAKGAGVYKVEAESGGQEFEDANGKLEHLLVALSAGASGWTTVWMNRTGAGYNLYSVEVIRAN